MAGKKPSASTPADQRLSGRGTKPGPKPSTGTSTAGSKGSKGSKGGTGK